MATSKTKVLDFTGQTIFIGLDVHSQSWSVTLQSEEFELKTYSQPPKPSVLINYLKDNYPGASYKAVYEAGFCGFNIQRELALQGVACEIIHPADVPTSDKEKRQKTDKVDSRKLAKMLKNKDMEAIYIPSIVQQEERNLLRVRQKIVRDKTRVKNRIKSYLKFQGLDVDGFDGRQWSKKVVEVLKRATFSTDVGTFAFRAYIDELVYLDQQEDKLESQIKQLSQSERYKENVALLRSVPSIGLISAMTFLTEIGDIHRFETFDDLCSFFGLIPNCHSSGEIERIGHITHRGNQYLKSILIECAWVAVRKDPALLQSYKELLPRMDSNKAIIRIARKLLSRIRHVLIKKEIYQKGIVK
jgi:transposase